MAEQWTEQEKRDVIEPFWRGDNPRCPSDKSLLIFDQTPMSPGGVRLHIHCPRCHRSLQTRRDTDPRKDEFREWTMEERASLIDALFQQGYGQCPSCECVHMNMKQTPMSGGTHIFIECNRCGNTINEMLK